MSDNNQLETIAKEVKYTSESNISFKEYSSKKTKEKIEQKYSQQGTQYWVG
jgi:hypothetical protein